MVIDHKSLFDDLQEITGEDSVHTNKLLKPLQKKISSLNTDLWNQHVLQNVKGDKTS